MNRRRQILSLILFATGTLLIGCERELVEPSNMAISDYEVNIPPGGSVAIEIPNPNTGHRNYRLIGLLKAPTVRVKVLVFDEINFKLWQAKEPYQAAYAIPELREEQINISIQDKSYMLVAQNLSVESPALIQRYGFRISYDLVKKLRTIQ